MKAWLTIRGFVAGAFAFVICPCHLPVTLPFLLVLTSGTAVGGWVVDNSTLIYAVSAVLFIGGVVLTVKWLFADEAKTCVVGVQDKPTSKL